MQCVLPLMTLLLSGIAALSADEPFRAVVVPVGPNNPRNSEAAIIPLADGKLLLGWTEFYAGDSADHGPARISGKISADQGRSWGDKFTLVENDGGCNVMEVNFMRLKDGRIALFYCQKNSESGDCRVMMRTSRDEGKSFEDPKQLSPDGKYTGLTNGRCIRLKSGRILLEAWENGDSYCYLSDDDGVTWRESQRIKPGDGSWEPACIELKDERVLMLTRTGLGGQFQSFSADGGATWSEPVLSQLVGTAAPVSISRIPTTGDLLAVWNNNPDTADAQNRNRTPLTSAISRDEGKSWTLFRNIEEAPGDAWAYPAVTWVGDNALLTYFNYAGGHSLIQKIIPAVWFYGDEPAVQLPATREEARGRAQLLHEMIHATLHLVHARYYRQDEGLQLPARALKDVFAEIESTQKVQVKWLVVNATAMNVDHNAQDEFARQAVETLSAGKSSLDTCEEGVYRFAGAITLSSDCLKCHVPNRKSVEDRTAGVLIAMPLLRNR